MHPSSMENMFKFRQKYVGDEVKLRVLDVGSLDVCGSYKSLFKEHNYLGFDIVPGRNVDITDWNDLSTGSIDVVISGQAFEHIEDDYAVMAEIYRVMKVGAICCIIAPSSGPKHYEPDYRRYQTEDFVVLANKVGLSVIEVSIDYVSSCIWNDCILVATKYYTVDNSESEVTLK